MSKSRWPRRHGISVAGNRALQAGYSLPDDLVEAMIGVAMRGEMSKLDAVERIFNAWCENPGTSHHEMFRRYRAYIRREKAKAWDEGWDSRFMNRHRYFGDHVELNPYRGRRK